MIWKQGFHSLDMKMVLPGMSTHTGGATAGVFSNIYSDQETKSGVASLARRVGYSTIYSKFIVAKFNQSPDSRKFICNPKSGNRNSWP